MKTLVTGGGGQLATALEETRPEGVSLRTCPIEELDLTVDESVRSVIDEYAPELVINTAAYTAVDAAESDRDMADMVNREGASSIARHASRIGARMVQVSTDFVFDGTEATPRRPEDPTNPVSVYGETKRAGELAVREILGDKALIVRTAWLYAACGSNFVNTMLGIMRERDEVRVVSDQIGSPTWANSLASSIWCMADRKLSGTQHWTDSGVASWYDFAVAIAEIGHQLDLIETMPSVIPVTTKDFPTPARRPAYSVLDKTGTWSLLEGTGCVPCAHWRTNLYEMMKGLTSV